MWQVASGILKHKVSWCFLSPLSHILPAHSFFTQLSGITTRFSFPYWKGKFKNFLFYYIIMQLCSLFEILDQLNNVHGTNNLHNIISGCVGKTCRNFLFLKLHQIMPQCNFLNSKIMWSNSCFSFLIDYIFHGLSYGHLFYLPSYLVWFMHSPRNQIIFHAAFIEHTYYSIIDKHQHMHPTFNSILV